MNTFVNAVINQEARTENGMKARKSTANPCVDLFFNIGAMRGKDVIPAFVAAYVHDPVTAIRIALWARDVRGGAGERKIFRDILKYMETNDPETAKKIVLRIPELGRWDDMLVANGPLKDYSFSLIQSALIDGNGLAAKWMPRKGKDAVELREFMQWSPKYYRKTLVNLTKVVESQMCANDWDNINFNHVPSVASSRYKKAFARHTDKYKEWTAALVSTDPEVKASVKVNAGAVYPYDVLKGVASVSGFYNGYSDANLQHIQAQWDALPNFVGNANILPLVDVSGSMTTPAGGHKSKSGVSCLDVAISLGLYLADKNTGKFKDTFLTFSSDPQLLNLRGNILDKIKQMVTSKWTMNTDLHKAIHKILVVAVAGNVPQSEMPKILLILSDMQFDSCTNYDDSAMEMIERKYAEFGYEVPKIVFWNLNSKDNAPVKFDKSGTALVSGFSPSIVKAVLAGDMEDFTPEAIMNKTIMNERYAF
jgi:hypothetical protein